jgi:ketosteroid isomerase-like protein
MRSQRLAILILCLANLGCVASQSLPTREEARRQVFAAEAAFARTMADRDHQAFSAFITDDAVFYAGTEPLRGKQAVVTRWAPLFSDPNAPFSWEPANVEILDSGKLAHSSGPVRDPNGAITGEFSSLWRYDQGTWKIIFDKGNAVCDCSAPQD